jgi:hypothetical protein
MNRLFLFSQNNNWKISFTNLVHVPGILPTGQTGGSSQSPTPTESDHRTDRRKPAERKGSAAPTRTERPTASEMDGAGDEGQQERHLVLAHKLFLLSRPDVDDLSKVALRAEVLDAVKSDGNRARSPSPLPSPAILPMRVRFADSLMWLGRLTRHGAAVRVAHGRGPARARRRAARRDAREDRRGDPQA